MRLVVRTIDGHTYYSDWMSNDELQKTIDETDGYIGTGANSEIRVETVDEALDFMEAVFKESLGADEGFVSMEIEGNRRVFNSNKVIWFQLERK